jgi:formate-nitrite transporter family protein
MALPVRRRHMPVPQSSESEEQKPSTEGVQKDLERPSAEDIYQQVSTSARQELARSTTALALSGFGAGAFMGLSAMGTAIALALLGASPNARIISRMFYPLGFIVVIIGRSQLFTENTLYPVALVLTERSQLWNTLRLWAVVLPTNVLGALAFAALASRTPALDSSFVNALAALGAKALSHPASTVFWSGIIGGWIIALAAWLVSASHSITGSVMVIWMLTFIIGLGDFAHCIASSCEIFVTVLTHHAPWLAFFQWFGPAVAGNMVGGICLVTILEYGQAIYGSESAQKDL